MSKFTLLVSALLTTAFAVTLIVCGCGGTSGPSLYFNVNQRASWSAGERLAFASYGGNGLLYIYTITNSGSNALLLTPSDNDDDYADEGGWHPAYSPDGSQIAFTSRRHTTPVIFLMDSTDGDRAGVTQVTTDTGNGADEQVSWKPDGTGLIYTSTRRNANHDIRTIDTDGGNLVELLNSDDDEQWASYKPTDDNIIVLQSDRDADNSEDTDIFIYNISSATFTKIADSPSDGTRIGFTRDRELWSVLATDGSDPQRITRRYQ